MGKLGCDLFMGKGHIDISEAEMEELLLELSTTASDS